MRNRRRPALLLTAALLAAPLLTACSGSSTNDVKAAAQDFLDEWTGGHPDAAAKQTTDAAATTALLKQTAEDLPDATLKAEVGKVTVRNDTATVAWKATWDLAAAPDWSYDATLDLRQADDTWRVVSGPAIVSPELGKGQHLVLTRSLPDRAAITDAGGQPLFAPTEVVNVGVDPGQVTDLPSLAATLGAATGVDPQQITTDVQKAKPGQFVPVSCSW